MAEAAPWLRAAGSAGTVAVVGRADALGASEAEDTQQGMFSGVAVCGELTWIFSTLGFPLRHFVELEEAG